MTKTLFLPIHLFFFFKKKIKLSCDCEGIGNLNGHMESESRGYEGLLWGYSLREANQREDQAILDFLVAFDFTIANSCFRTREEHLITYKFGFSCFQIVFFFLIRISFL